MATKWSMFYPTPLLNMASKKGIGGFIDPTMKIPPMLGFSLSLILTRQFQVWICPLILA